ncbi:hypothetical protein FGO68_gene3135 [Halteria grandinella]|uniref:Uncharacterized protein n=1 Tax=Halteria grandinella TaxID=5974 RepID=A0A8J8NWI4_HALGN|nr:hypothetical protein FGO68_gene3135 [Halteria grandinella]
MANFENVINSSKTQLLPTQIEGELPPGIEFGQNQYLTQQMYMPQNQFMQAIAYQTLPGGSQQPYYVYYPIQYTQPTYINMEQLQGMINPSQQAAYAQPQLMCKSIEEPPSKVCQKANLKVEVPIEYNFQPVKKCDPSPSSISPPKEKKLAIPNAKKPEPSKMKKPEPPKMEISEPPQEKEELKYTEIKKKLIVKSKKIRKERTLKPIGAMKPAEVLYKEIKRTLRPLQIDEKFKAIRRLTKKTFQQNQYYVVAYNMATRTLTSQCEEKLRQLYALTKYGPPCKINGPTNSPPRLYCQVCEIEIFGFEPPYAYPHIMLHCPIKKGSGFNSLISQTKEPDDPRNPHPNQQYCQFCHSWVDKNTSRRSHLKFCYKRFKITQEELIGYLRYHYCLVYGFQYGEEYKINDIKSITANKLTVPNTDPQSIRKRNSSLVKKTNKWEIPAQDSYIEYDNLTPQVIIIAWEAFQRTLLGTKNDGQLKVIRNSQQSQQSSHERQGEVTHSDLTFKNSIQQKRFDQYDEEMNEERAESRNSLDDEQIVMTQE